jgi:hypothetical protein
VNGTVVGGWGFVVAAYAISAVLLAGYAISVWRRLENLRHMGE